MPDQSISQLSSGDPSSASLAVHVTNSTTMKTTVDELVGFWSTAAGDIVYATAARNLGRVGIGTSGTYMRVSSANIPSWAPRQWGQSVAWKNPNSSDIAMFEVPFNITVSSFSLIGDSAGTVTVEARLEGFTSTPASSVANVSSAQPMSLSNAQRNTSAVSSWSDNTWDKGQWVTLYLVNPSSLTFLSLSLVGTERAS